MKDKDILLYRIHGADDFIMLIPSPKIDAYGNPRKVFHFAQRLSGSNITGLFDDPAECLKAARVEEGIEPEVQLTFTTLAQHLNPEPEPEPAD